MRGTQSALHEQVRQEFATRLRAAREARGFAAAEQFALGLGVKPHTYRMWERGDAEPDLDTLKRICILLGITANDLLPLAAGKSPERSTVENEVSEAPIEDAVAQESENDSAFREIGERLALTRRALGLRQNVFAERAGIAQSAYSQHETGVRRPSIENAISLCEAYDITLEWIYRGDMRGLRHGLAEEIKKLSKEGS